jgi:hypothetical protein
MRTNKGKFDKSRAKNEKPDSELNCVTEDGFSVKIFLNSSKDKLIFKINFPEVKKYYYSKEFTYDELTKICPLFLIEENIININNLIKESVKNNGIKTSNTTNEKKICTSIIITAIHLSTATTTKTPISKSRITRRLP